MGLLETLYEGMRGVEDTAREWVQIKSMAHC